MTTRIVVDSTCDLPSKVIEEHRIAVIPMWLHAGGESYRDLVDLSRDAFYARLPGWDPPPTTAVPGPEVFRAAYQQLASEGATEILSIHISPALSGVLNAARLAAEATTEASVTPVDSRQLSLGTGMVALRAAEAAQAGASAKEVLAELEAYIPRVHTLAALSTVEYLRRSGRISGFESNVAAFFRIKPLLKMHDGQYMSEKIRSHRRALQRLIDLVDDLGPLDVLHLVHTHSPDAVADLRDKGGHLFPEQKETWSVDVTPVLGTHLGPGAVGFVAVESGSE